MIALSNPAVQTVEPGQTLVLNTVISRTGCGEVFRQGTNSVKLRVGGVYEINFGANIASATAGTPVQLAIALGGFPIADATMISTPSAADVFNHIATSKWIANCCDDFDRITVVNNGTAPITVAANPNLTISRRG